MAHDDASVASGRLAEVVNESHLADLPERFLELQRWMLTERVRLQRFEAGQANVNLCRRLHRRFCHSQALW